MPTNIEYIYRAARRGAMGCSWVGVAAADCVCSVQLVLAGAVVVGGSIPAVGGPARSRGGIAWLLLRIKCVCLRHLLAIYQSAPARRGAAAARSGDDGRPGADYGVVYRWLRLAQLSNRADRRRSPVATGGAVYLDVTGVDAELVIFGISVAQHRI